MKKLFLLVCIFFCVCSEAQQKAIDNLLIKMRQSEGEKKLELLEDICEFYKTNSREKGFIYADSLLNLAKKLNDKKSISRALSYKGVFNPDASVGIKDLKQAIHLDSILGLKEELSRDRLNLASLYNLTNQTDLSVITLKDVIDYSEKNKLYNLYLKATYNLSLFSLQKANYQMGLEFCEKSLKYFEKSDDKNTQTRIYALLSKVYSHLENHEKSMEYALKGLEMVENYEIGLLVQGLVYHELSETNLNLGDEKKGFEYYNKTIDISKSSFDYSGLVNSLWTISSYISSSETKNKALLDKVFKDAKEIAPIAKQVKDLQSFYSIQMILANLSFTSGNYKQSYEYLTEILEVANEGNNNIDIETIDQALFVSEKINLKNGQFKEAYFNSKNRFKIRDSIYSIQYHDKLASLDVKYQTEKKEKENLLLRTEKAEQELATAEANRQKWLFAIGLLGAIIALAVFAFYYRKNKKQKEIIESLQKELHHRVKNNLSIIDTFIEVAKEEFSEERFVNKLQELQNRIDSINTVHLQLYQSDDITNVNVKKYIDSLCQNVQDSFDRPNVRINKNLNDDMSLNPSHSFPLGLIVNEFLTNSFKYAFDDKEGNISIAVNQKQSKILLSLSDDGKGLPKNFDIDSLESFGVRIMKLLTEQLDGSFDLKSDDGVTLQVQFPK